MPVSAETVNTDTDELRCALRMLLDHVDYLHGRCSLVERVGKALPVEVIRKAREVLQKAA
jgi:hypothetical protein